MARNRAQFEILSGWKEIADYLHKGVRTVQRYEREFGLPIRRPAARSKSAVIATKAELDAWVAASPVRHAFQLNRPAGQVAPTLSELHHHLEEMKRLRVETAQLRMSVINSLNMLRDNLLVAIPTPPSMPQPTPVRRVLPEVLAFDSRKKNIQ